MSHTDPKIDAYRQQYKNSIEHPQDFWGQQAHELISWEQPWKSVLSGSLADQSIQWFEGASLNACYNCLDRHLPEHAHKIALYWVGNEPNESRRISYGELHEEVCRFANILKSHTISKGDVVTIYLPMIPEALIAMLACARIGAIHSVVFAGFSAKALHTRLHETASKLLITADYSYRGTKEIQLKVNADAALTEAPHVHSVIVVHRSSKMDISMQPERDYWYHEELRNAKPSCPITYIKANDPLFILYTSGSTGQPKGVLHTAGGYMVYAAMTFKHVFDYQPQDIFFCTADIGWITGHTYCVYGPMCHAATQIMFEGIPTYPSAARYWEIVDEYNVTLFYTAPTAIRALMRENDDTLSTTSRTSLRLLGSVGEPINPEAWEWYYTKVGHQQCPIVDTWWQTETGGIMITPLPGITPLKPGSASWPFYGITPAIVDEKGSILEGECVGDLVITTPWPGMMHTLYKNKQRMSNVYFSKYPGKYLTGDTAHRDKDGYYWIIGRNDDVINVSGHRLGTAEIESALLETPGVAEAAVVDIPHEIKGSSIYAFVTLKKGVLPSPELKKSIIDNVVTDIGAIARPQHIHWSTDLPKTRSGKIMRRVLRKIARGETDELGDTSTLSNPESIIRLLEERETDQ